MKFESYGLSDSVTRNLVGLGFRKPTDIQYRTIPSILSGEDVLAIAPTGTGKTAAYVIPMVQMLHAGKSSKRVECVRGLVLVPTRELGLQVGEVFDSIAAKTRVKCFVLHGGVEQDAQIERLLRGVDVVIATPGRMFDLIHQGYLKLEAIEMLVIDEADHMLDRGFLDDIRFVKKKLTRRHQTVFISATINSKIKKLAYAMVRGNAIRIQLSPKDPVSKQVDHFVMRVKQEDKRFFLESFLKDLEQPTQVMVFVRTRVRAERLMNAMKRVGVESAAMHGDLLQADRIAILERFRSGDLNVLIATDVGARGIDIPAVAFVINYDLPVKVENYVHRVGRTGRGLRRGHAISYCSGEESTLLEQIEQFLDKPISEIKMGKRTYKHTVEIMSRTEKPSNEVFSELADLVQEQNLGKKRKPSKKKRG